MTDDKKTKEDTGQLPNIGSVGRDLNIGGKVEVTYNNDELLQRALKRLEEDLDRKNAELDKKNEIIAAQAAALSRLSSEKKSSTHPEKYEQALQAAAAGDVTLADQLLLGIEQQEASEAARHNTEAARIAVGRGALWFSTDTQKALAACKRATELDPSNLSAWILLGHLYDRVGELDSAISAYEKVLALSDDGAWKAIVTGSLGTIYRAIGKLFRAEEYYRMSIACSEELGLGCMRVLRIATSA